MLTTPPSGSLPHNLAPSGRNCVGAGFALRPLPRQQQQQRYRCRAVRGGRPQLLPPGEDQLLSSMLHTGIKGSLAMLGASALGVDVFAHLGLQHLPGSLSTGLALAAPCAAADGALLLMLLKQQHAWDDGEATPAASASAAAAAAEAVQLHTIRFNSLAGAASGGRRLLLEASAQLSEELLVRDVMLGALSTWLTSRMIQAGVCDATPLLGGSSNDGSVVLPSCAASAQWLAAALLCAMMASRLVVYGRGKAAAAKEQREAAAAEAATRRALLRYEPLAVQQKAAAEAAAAGASTQDTSSTSEAAAGDWGTDGSVQELAHAWLGARYAAGQAALFAAFILSGGSLAASLTAGMAMQLASGACAERYLAANEASAGITPPK